MAELVAAVDYAEKTGASNPYWSWDQDTRREFREYHSAMHTTATAPTTSWNEDEENDNDDGFCEYPESEEIFASQQPRW